MSLDKTFDWQCPFLSDEWEEFHKMWWGKPGKSKLAQPDPFLCAVQHSIRQQLGILKGEDGFLFRRTEYAAFITRIRKAKTLSLWGCLLLGQPGIGKSVYILFLFLICMSEEEIVLFTNASGSTFLIDEKGVMEMPTTEFRDWHLPLSPTRIWSLVNSAWPNDVLPYFVSDAYPSLLFFVAALSPDLGHYNLYKEVTTKGSVVTWWMSPWQDEEILLLLNKSTCPIIKSKKELFDSLPAVQTLITKVGPCPRDIFTVLRDPQGFKNQIEQAVEELGDLDKIAKLMRNPLALSNVLSHHIILIQRLGPVTDTHESDCYCVCLKTSAIRKRLMEKFNCLDIMELEVSTSANSLPNCLDTVKRYLQCSSASGKQSIPM